MGSKEMGIPTLGTLNVSILIFSIMTTSNGANPDILYFMEVIIYASSFESFFCLKSSLKGKIMANY